MTLITETEIESTIKQVFPAAEVLYIEKWGYHEDNPPVDVTPGAWIDELKGQLEREEVLGADDWDTVQVLARLNAVIGIDRFGRRAWVPADYEERYGEASPQDGWDETDFGPYGEVSIDVVPIDDRVNTEWALQVIDRAFPEAEFGIDETGGAVLDPGLHFVEFDSEDQALFTDELTDIIDEEIHRREEAVPGETVWEREAVREERRAELRSLAKSLADQTERTLSPENRLGRLRARLEARGLIDEEERLVLADVVRILRSRAERPLEEILAGGESKTVEYKSTALSTYPEGARSDHAASELVRTVAAFMNSDGGVLVVGVHDSGRILGIQPDLVRVKGNRDVLARNLLDKLGAALGVAPVSNYVQVSFESDPCILVVRVHPAARQVYAQIMSDELFCVRVGASTKELKHSEAHEYIEHHWARGASQLE